MMVDTIKKNTLNLSKITLVSLFAFATATQANPDIQFGENEPHKGVSAPHPQPAHAPIQQPIHAPIQQHRIQNSIPAKITHPHGPSPIEHEKINNPKAQPNILHEPIHHGTEPKIIHQKSGTPINNNVINKPQPNVLHEPIHHGTEPKIILQKPGAPINNNVINPAKPNNNTHHIAPVHVISNNKPSHLTNHFTQNNTHTATLKNQQFIHKANNAHWVQQINGYQHQYHNQFYKNNIQSFNVYGHYWQNNYYHEWYNPWYQWGFYGGFWYPVRPYYAIENYFSYPMVQWFFMDDPVAPEYYSSYYSEPIQQSPCVGAFPYKHIYFPTDTLRDLLVEVSGLPQGLRCTFRTAIINLSSQLQQDVSTYYSINFSLQQNNIVVNYYQNLQNKGIVIAGFVNQGTINVAFEALLDLQNPSHSITFAPDGQTPTQDQLQVLQQLNNRIIKLGGDPFTAQQEPSTGIVEPGNQGSAPGP